MTSADDHLDDSLDMSSDVKTAAPILPASFWLSEVIQEAFQARHFGQVLKAYRHSYSPNLKQGDLAKWLGLTQGQVSRIERGSSPVTDLKKLTTWALLLHIPAEHLWFNLEAEGCTPSVGGPIMDSHQLEEENVQRRSLFKSIGLGASLLAIPAPQRGLVEPSPLQYSIGKADVEVIREMTGNFRRLDNRFGGGHAYSVVNNYLQSHVAPTLRSGRYSASLRSSLFLAAAELYQLAGWMAYDTADHAVGHRHLRTALKLSEEVRDDGLAAEMLAGMSHQAAFQGQADQAIELASAASYAARRAGIPKLQAEAAVMEAHGLALRGDHRGCILGLQEAERLFTQTGSDSPNWLAYFDEAYLSAKFGHALRDLGRSADSERFARNSLQMSEGYERGRMFNTALLAGVLADQGNVEEAVHNGQLAVNMSTDMRSARTSKYLLDVHRRLVPYKDQASVRALFKSMTQAGVKLANA